MLKVQNYLRINLFKLTIKRGWRLRGVDIDCFDSSELPIYILGVSGLDLELGGVR